MIVSAPTKPRPPRSTLDVDAFPAPLRGRDQWVTFCYGFRDGAWTKIPKQASGPNVGKNAKTNDSTTWSSFKDALAAFEADQALDGISYIFAEDDPYCCVDIDKVKTSPERLAWALGIIERFGTYAEWSVSGNGFHIVGKGKMPDADGTPQKGRSNQKNQIEAYSRRRQLTFTGKVVEESATAIVDVQPALDWLLANEFKPKDASKVTVRSERTTGLIATTDRMARIEERMCAGPRGAQLRRLLDGDAGDYRKADGSIDYSAADLSLCSGLNYYADGDALTVEAMWLASGLAGARPNGHKLDRADYRQGTLNQAGGGKTYRDTHGYSAWEDPPQFRPKPLEPRVTVSNDGAATCPSDEPATLEDALALITHLRAENAELSQSNLDLLGWVDRTAGFVEELLAANATLSTKLTRIQSERTVDRRMELDKQRLRRKLKPMQAESLVALATIGPAMANSAGVQAPYVTREALANVAGGKPATVRNNLKILDLPGSPVKCETVPKGEKSLTSYDFAGMDTPDLLTALADWVDTMEEAPKLSPERPVCDRCAPGTTQTSVIMCDGCQKVLARKHMTAPNVMKNSTLETTPPPVDVLRTYRAGKQHVGRVTPASIKNARASRQRPQELPSWLSEWPEQDASPPECTRVDCREPAANGFICAGHLYGDPLLAVSGGSE